MDSSSLIRQLGLGHHRLTPCASPSVPFRSSSTPAQSPSQAFPSVPFQHHLPRISISIRDENEKKKRNASSFQTHTIRHLEGHLTKAEGLRFAVVVAKFNEVVTKLLLDGALATFTRYSVKEQDIDVVWVPGSFEIGVAAQRLAKSGKYHAVLCIGAVIRGDTSHHDAVANSAASGVLSAGINSGVPCIFGVLTCDDMDQALDRAGEKAGNKGSEAALTAVVWVPGSFEIGVVAQRLAKSGKHHAVLCIGAVIRGDTSHYDAVANSAASGVLSAGISSGAVHHWEGYLTKAEGLRFAVVVAKFNEVVTKLLLDSALATFTKYSVKEQDIDVVWVPGSFEIGGGGLKTRKIQKISCCPLHWCCDKK